ncbi:NAD-dependent epimerase/dehydratase family protein [Campylobacter sp. LR185c]|uniref:NAD-dependent epimerase/dehydratase family protein n=1 Tax=Campylobacter sp. LR185c TaxID=2014525 RepID=UPI001237A111|nr:NAD-dependent epimerase/dehydratase family protein [Campylobacter sp. LR185c]KAA6224585.1 NAD-dependent epimerase/dehydratase family protein [Campylobacter sp. LR185c]KAA8603552.1 GDP-fucose synthetase [Campylobacter sp. LR185c]
MDSKIYIAGHMGSGGSAIKGYLLKNGYTNLVYKNHKELDLTNQKAVSEFFKSEKPDFVFLCAVLPCGVANTLQKADFLYVNTMIVNNILYSAYENKIKKLICYGSGYMYPKNAINPIKEESLLDSKLEKSVSYYGLSKIHTAMLCEAFNLQYNTNFLCLALNNLYGISANFDLANARVLPALLRKFHLARLLEEDKEDLVLKDLNMSLKDAKKYLSDFSISKESVEIWGTGQTRREFLHSQDFASASFYVMQNVDFKDLKDNALLNIGSGVDYSIKEVALMVKKIVGFNGDLVFNANKPDNTTPRLMDTSKINSLGWKSKIDLERGIKMMYEWYKNTYGGGDLVLNNLIFLKSA